MGERGDDRICIAILHTIWTLVCPLSTLYLFEVYLLEGNLPEDTLLLEITTGDAHLRLHLPPSSKPFCDMNLVPNPNPNLLEVSNPNPNYAHLRLDLPPSLKPFCEMN